MRVVTGLEGGENAEVQKLIKLKVDYWTLVHRTVWVGVAEHFEPEFLIGQQWRMPNQPSATRRMMESDSEGMILDGRQDG